MLRFCRFIPAFLLLVGVASFVFADDVSTWKFTDPATQVWTTTTTIILTPTGKDPVTETFTTELGLKWTPEKSTEADTTILKCKLEKFAVKGAGDKVLFDSTAEDKNESLDLLLRPVLKSEFIFTKKANVLTIAPIAGELPDLSKENKELVGRFLSPEAFRAAFALAFPTLPDMGKPTSTWLIDLPPLGTYTATTTLIKNEPAEGKPVTFKSDTELKFKPATEGKAFPVKSFPDIKFAGQYTLDKEAKQITEFAFNVKDADRKLILTVGGKDVEVNVRLTYETKVTTKYGKTE